MEQNLPHPEALVPLEPGRRVAYVSGPRGDERDLPLFDLVARHVDAFGDAPAMISGEGTWSVAETWQRVQLLAAELHAAMAGQRLPVVVMARKGLTQGAALLACLRLGVPYIPLNPDDDSLRTRHIMTLAAPFVLVRDAADTRKWEALGPTFKVVVHDPRAPLVEPGPLPPHPAPEDPVMVIFTSGSTGVPKGWTLSLAEVLDASWRRHDYWGLEPSDRAIYHGSLAIIGMAMNTLAAMMGGGAVVYTPEAPTVTDLITQFQAHRGTLVAGYTGFVRLIPQHAEASRALAHLKSLTIYGDRMEWRDVAELRAVMPQGAFLTYDYGLTESCFVIGGYVGDTRESCDVPMGLAHPGLELWFEGEPDREADGSLTGLLAISLPPGQTGYWRSTQDAHRFVAHPGDPRLRVFLTGDIVRLQPDGVFRFLGRSDNQVKLRGNRIELEEIEAVARQAPGIGVAGVVPRRDGQGRVERLVLHVAPRGDARPDVDAVARHVAQALPAFMRPAAVVLSPALPLTSTAKVDRVRLAEFDRQVRDRRAAARSREETASGGWPDGLCRRIAAALAQELQLRPGAVTPGATFPGLEGDSLRALAAALHIEKVFGVTIDPAMLLTEEILGEIVPRIAAQVREATPAG